MARHLQGSFSFNSCDCFNVYLKQMYFSVLEPLLAHSGNMAKSMVWEDDSSFPPSSNSGVLRLP